MFKYAAFGNLYCLCKSDCVAIWSLTAISNKLIVTVRTDIGYNHLNFHSTCPITLYKNFKKFHLKGEGRGGRPTTGDVASLLGPPFELP